MRIKFEIDLTAIWSRIVDIARQFNIGHFLLLYFAAHMLQIAFPSDGSMIFDEAHYIPASLKTLEWQGANAEHPPLPKMVGAIGIWLLGNNWFGWRFPQVVMQVAVLYLFYLIARRFSGERWALAGTMILGFDTIFFIHGGALLIDMPSFLFGLLALELYFRKRYNWSAASMGLGFLAREMSIFYFAALGVYHLTKNWRTVKPMLKLGLRYTLIALVVFGSLLWWYDLQFQVYSGMSVTNMVSQNIVLGPSTTGNTTGLVPVTTIIKTVQLTSKEMVWNPVQHVLFIWHYHGPTGMVIPTSTQPWTYPWNWILPTAPWDAPTYFRVDVAVSAGAESKHYIPIWYLAQPNLFLWYSFIPVIAGLVWLWRRQPTKHPQIAFVLAGLLVNFLPWVISRLLWERLGFNYYMIWALPYVACGLAMVCSNLPPRFAKVGKLIMIIGVIYSVASFIWFFPVRPMP